MYFLEHKFSIGAFESALTFAKLVRVWFGNFLNSPFPLIKGLDTPVQNSLNAIKSCR